MEWSRILYNICDANFDSALFIRKRIRRTCESHSAEGFFAQILLFKANACITCTAFCSRPRLISVDTIMRREKRGMDIEISISALWFELILACTLIVFTAITVLEYRTRHSQLWFTLYFPSILHIILARLKTRKHVLKLSAKILFYSLVAFRNFQSIE